MKKTLSTSGFSGGIHPVNDGKKLSNTQPIRKAPLFERYFVPLQQNIGAPPKLIIEAGAEVKKGQKVAEADGFVSVPLHSPTSGIFEGMVKRPGPLGVMIDCLSIKSDMKDEWAELMPKMNYRETEPQLLKQRIIDAGIVGMGGAAFPAAVKLSPPPDKKITALIINGAECEPYLSADHRLMLENPDKVLIGTAIMAKILNVSEVFIAVEINKLDAIETLLAKANPFDIKIVGLEVQYPQGAEKQLIYSVTKRKVPIGGLPMDAGVVVQNAGTANAVAEAVCEGKPLIERITTISGEAITTPGNWKLKIGTPISEVIKLAGGIKGKVEKIIMGGPMMGFAQRSLDVSIQKNSSGILLLEQVPQYKSSHCIRCGRCLKGCPMNLNPSFLGSLIESEKFAEAFQNHVMDCIECGGCAYICPAHRPLIQHIRRAKAEIRNMKK